MMIHCANTIAFFGVVRYSVAQSFIYMAITKGAKKAHRSSLHKRVFNIRRKSAMHETVKTVKKQVAGGALKEAETSLPQAFKAIDKAAKRGVIKKNTAARKKARLVAAMRRKEAK